MKTLKILTPLFLLITIILWMSSCKKDTFITDSSAKLEFSEDTIIFDTVFVTMGSTNNQLIVHNNNNQKINISSIRLAGGTSSSFRINVDGTPGYIFKDIEIAANDSIFIFVEVTVDPTSGTLPFIITDSIVFETNGNMQDVDLVAWGQNAHFFHPNKHQQGLPDYSIIPCNAEWDSVLPYVIYGYAVVDSGCCLTIKEGTKIYFYNASGLWVFSGGCIHVNGTKEHPVTFRGTRLESYYDDKPNQWDRIWINEGSNNNTIDYAVIKNGFIGLQLEELFEPTLPKGITVNNTIIENMNGVGVLTRNYDATFNNCLISNCGSYSAALTIGGSYGFNQCTFANYWHYSQRSTPSIFLNNYGEDNNGNPVGVSLSKADFKNCIIYGNIENEFETDFITSATSNYFFDHSILKVKSTTDLTDPLHYNVIYKNNDPDFKNTNDYDFTLDTLSFAKDKGDPALLSNPVLQFDLNGVDRTQHTPPDLGAYERKD
ncbi:MAG: hypothetical protein ABI723_00200 [Bacteroidia bacterium]